MFLAAVHGTVQKISFSFRIEESFIGEILDCEGRSHVCKIYVDSYRKILNEKTDEVDASMKRFTTFIKTGFQTNGYPHDEDEILNVLVANPIHVYNLIHRIYKLLPIICTILQVTVEQLY